MIKVTFILMPDFKNNQKGLAPLVIILIVAVTIFTGYGVYKSSNQFNIRSDKTVEKSGGRLQDKEPAKVTVDLANSGRLAEKAVEIKTDETASGSAKFSIIPPAGWDKLPPSGQIAVEFLSPAKDTVEEEILFFDVQPNITVFVSKEDYKDLDEAYSASSGKGNTIINKQKTTINGTEAIVTNFTKDVLDFLKDVLETQVKQEIAKSGTMVSESQLDKEMKSLLKKAKIKGVSYTFYKDGYYINVTGKALEPFWDSHGPQMKKSMDTFKFLP